MFHYILLQQFDPKRDTITIGSFLSHGPFLSRDIFECPIAGAGHVLASRKASSLLTDKCVFVKWKDIFVRLVAGTGGGRDKCTKSRQIVDVRCNAMLGLFRM